MPAQTVDYTKHKSLPAYMIEHHSNLPFDAIFDIVHSEGLYTSSPAYLTESGKFLLLGGLKIAKNLNLSGLLGWLFGAFVSQYRPRLLGGTPRQYQIFTSPFNQKDAEHLLGLVEAGKVRAVIDSRWNFDQAHEVCLFSLVVVFCTSRTSAWKSP